ncbi:MAG: hypothetical protein QXS02_05930 [Candidatus Thermoplasmatota archaeon]
MADRVFSQIDKQLMNKLSLYVNVVLFIIIGVAIIALIIDSYNTGKLTASGATGDQMFQQGIYIARDIAFLSVSLTLIFYQFFRNLRIIMQRSW